MSVWYQGTVVWHPAEGFLHVTSLWPERDVLLVRRLTDGRTDRHRLPWTIVNPRAAVTPDGVVEIVAQGQPTPTTDTLVRITRGTEGARILDTGLPCASPLGAAIGPGPEGRLTILTQDTPQTYRLIDVLTDHVSAPLPIPILEGTSQGVLALTPAGPVWTDQAPVLVARRWRLRFAVSAGALTAGQLGNGLDSLALVEADGRLRILAHGCYEPQIAADPAGVSWAVTARRLGEDAVVVVGPPWPAEPPLVVPEIPPIGRPLYVAPGDMSAEPDDHFAYGYAAAPGNAEVIWREADLAARVDPAKPFLAVKEALRWLDVGMPLRGVLVHLAGGDGPAEWATDVWLAREAAERFSVPLYAYVDRGTSIAPAAALPVDGFLLQAYPRLGESVEDVWRRIDANHAEVASRVVGFVLAAYTGTGDWHPQVVLDGFREAADRARRHPALRWLTVWPWLAPPARGGPTEVPAFRVGVARLAAAVTGIPSEEGPSGEDAAPGDPSTDGNGGPAPSPDPDRDSEETLMPIPTQVYLTVPHAGALVVRDGVPVTYSVPVIPDAIATVRTHDDGTVSFDFPHGTLSADHNVRGGLAPRPRGTDGEWERFRIASGRAFVAKIPPAATVILQVVDAETGLPLR